MAHVSFTQRQASIVVNRVAEWLADWREIMQEARTQAELRRKLAGVDNHLLRDMGLKWTGRHYERVSQDC